MNNERKNFPKTEEEIVKFWQDNKIFEKSIANRDGQPDFVFYDGPPFVTGLPHHGHILSSTSKDLVGRYKTMRGYRVLRRWGWDCHGLPMENMIEKQLGISGRKEIEKLGIDKFNEACESAINMYDKEWETIVNRIGRFVDYKNSYKTMDNDFMESVWWGFKQLHNKELVYQDTRISLYCPRCETPLSNFEIAMDNSYKNVTDPSIFVKFKLKDKNNEYLLVWTTTPWTLPANSAVAVNPRLTYLKVKLSDGESVYIAQELFLRMKDELGVHEIEAEVTGEEMVGWEYEPLFNYFELEKKAYVIVPGDFVTAEDGSGLVHIAPTFGDEDYQLGKKFDLAFIETVDSQAKFLPQIKEWAGQNVWEANKSIIKFLEEKGQIFKITYIKHEYPFCHRCETKLIYKTQLAWFVRIMPIKGRMLDLNEQIKWHPEHLQHGRFGKGLETAPDWNISRSRYWGNPIPIWICDSCHGVSVIESIADLEKKSGRKVEKLHRPWIDEVVWGCECGKGEYKRVPEVFDCWFESGSMPWASVHYPFENKKYFEQNYPAEFISEYIAQTRGWFYNLHVLATGIFDKPSFVNAVTTGTILAEDGTKMSKSKKNFTDPQLLFDKLGVDSMRYYLMASPLMDGENLNYSDKEQEDAFRKIIMLTWNIYTFFATYESSLKDRELKESKNILDKWILSRLNQVIVDLTEDLDGYDITDYAHGLGGFIDELSTWYLRRSRDRFKDEENPQDQQAALNTMYNVLLTLSKLMAPITPFIAEDLYRHLNGPLESVHLENWPQPEPTLIHGKIIANMAAAREIIEKALAIRALNGVKIRQALGTAYITAKSLPEEYLPLVVDEINVRDIKLVEELPAETDFIKINADERTKVALDLELSDALRIDGHYRELTRAVNNYRKELGMTVTDHINLYIFSEHPDISEVIKVYDQELLKAVKADSLLFEKKELTDSKDLKLNDLPVWIGIEKL